MGSDLSSFSMMKAISHVMISSVTRLRKRFKALFSYKGKQHAEVELVSVFISLQG